MRYLLDCLIDFLDIFTLTPLISHWWKALIGFCEVASVIAVFVVSVIFLTWYYAILIAIGYVAIILAIAAVIEALIKKKKH